MAVELVTIIGSMGMHHTELFQPEAVAVGKDGAIYVADAGNNRIQVYEPDGSWLRKWGKYGKNSREFDCPMGIAIGECQMPTKLLIDRLMEIPELSVFPPGLLPICVEYVKDECVYVADHNNSRMQVFSAYGDFVRMWLSEYKPSHCTVSAASSLIYVSSHQNYVIQVFNLNGLFVRQWGTTTRGRFYMFPTHMTIHQDGLIYVAGGLDTILCYTEDGVLVHVLDMALTETANVHAKYEMKTDKSHFILTDIDGCSAPLVHRIKRNGGYGACRAPNDLVYIANTPAHEILVLKLPRNYPPKCRCLWLSGKTSSSLSCVSTHP